MFMWFFYALFVALATSIVTPLIKKISEKVNPLAVLLVGNLFVLPLMFVLIMFFGGIPKLSNNFFIFIIIASILDSAAFIASIRGIQMSPVSLIAPITSFNPVFTTLIAIFTLNEIPNPTKFIGIAVIVLGSYLLNITDIKHGVHMPFKKLFLSRGVQLVLLSTIIWSLTPVFQKKAIFETTPLTPMFPSFISFLIMTLFLAPFAVTKVKKDMFRIKKRLLLFIIFAPIAVLSQFAAFYVFSQVNVGYATAVFKLSSLFIILWGAIFFKEERIKERILGGSVMIIGTILIAV